GLQASAVITFLDQSARASDLQSEDQYRFLSISYNNLVDWYLYVEVDSVSYFNNRFTPALVSRQRISRTEYDGLRNISLEALTETTSKPTLLSVEETLINIIVTWKRVLSAELGHS